MKANIRNTKIKIAKCFIENNYKAEETFSRLELSQLLFVREKEFEEFKHKLLVEQNSKFKLKIEFYEEIEKWKKLHVKSKASIEEAIQKYKEIYSKFQSNYNYNKYSEELLPLIEKLHWFLLPVYPDFIIDNRGISPEEDIKEYHNHFHSLQYLYREIDKPKDYWKTIKGDVNLNQELNFEVQTNRWSSSPDMYKVTRVYNGWFVSNLGISGLCQPDGLGFEGKQGGFLANFKQDYVAYPKIFHFIIENLWRLADDTEMSINELQNKINDVAKLINETEKTVKKFTPVWYD